MVVADKHANQALSKAKDAQAKALTNTADIKALETGVEVIETMTIEAREDSTIALRMSGPTFPSTRRGN